MSRAGLWDFQQSQSTTKFIALSSFFTAQSPPWFFWQPLGQQLVRAIRHFLTVWVPKKTSLLFSSTYNRVVITVLMHVIGFSLKAWGRTVLVFHKRFSGLESPNFKTTGSKDLDRFLILYHVSQAFAIDLTCVLTQQYNVNTPSWTYRRYTDLDGKQSMNKIDLHVRDRTTRDSKEVTPHLLKYRIKHLNFNYKRIVLSD